MRIVFAGSPSIAVPSLEALVDLQLAGNDYEVTGILTNPDSPKGRRTTPEPTEVSAAAALLSEKLNTQGQAPIIQLKPEKLLAETREKLAALKPDILVSFAFGHIFGPKCLALFPLGGINIHPSLLPKYRGPTPIPAAILGRDTETGITIQDLVQDMDAGDILAQERFPLQGRETTESLSKFVAQRAALLLIETLHGLVQGHIIRRRQNHGEASFCFRLSKEDGRINWSLSAEAIDAQIRAFTPWPLSWTMHKQQCLYVREAKPYQHDIGKEKSAPPGSVLGMDKHAGILVQTGEGVLGITQLQYAAKKVLEWRIFLNGARDFLDTSLD
jgi:methionyl-tRNA formyltransferase